MIRESLPVRLLLRGSGTLGLPRLSASVGGRRLRVLMYHGVSVCRTFQGVVNHFGYNVPSAAFASQVDYLVEHCNPVSLSDVLAGRLAARRTNVLLTFDDGYENNFESAFPILQRHEVAALFALPTGFVCDRQPLWNDRLEAAVARTARSEVRLDWDGEEARFELAREAGRVELLLWLMRRAVAVEPDRRADLVALAADALEVEVGAEAMFADPDYRPLRAEQIHSMAASGLAQFASHSVSHFMMARLSASQRRRELERSKQAVEALSGAPCRAFCVPGGSYDTELVQAAHDVGFEVVLTSDWGWTDPEAPTWNRCGIFAGWDAYRFADEVHGPVVRSLVAVRRAVRGA